MELVRVVDAATARILRQQVEARLLEAGVDEFRRFPPEPTTCCGRGCNGCVWEGYFEAVEWWREEALAML